MTLEDCKESALSHCIAVYKDNTHAQVESDYRLLRMWEIGEEVELIKNTLLHGDVEVIDYD